MKVHAHHFLEVVVNLFLRLMLTFLFDRVNLGSVEDTLDTVVIRRPLEFADNPWTFPDLVNLLSQICHTVLFDLLLRHCGMGI